MGEVQIAETTSLPQKARTTNVLEPRSSAIKCHVVSHVPTTFQVAAATEA